MYINILIICRLFGCIGCGRMFENGKKLIGIKSKNLNIIFVRKILN